jgi:hypothetical protein
MNKIIALHKLCSKIQDLVLAFYSEMERVSQVARRAAVTVSDARCRFRCGAQTAVKTTHRSSKARAEHVPRFRSDSGGFDVDSQGLGPPPVCRLICPRDDIPDWYLCSKNHVRYCRRHRVAPNLFHLLMENLKTL